ncbi:MAG: CarD family transcriptional regulator [Oscillospiraceae bacterium]|nr:CarD family transcriptional regulator [Oscillospiraceae bacterium]
MFRVGEVVLFGAEGVFRVDEIAPKKIGKTVTEYYVLRSLYRSSNVLYIPVGHGGLEEKMYPVMSRKEIDELIDRLPSAGVSWVDNENERKLRFKEILSCGDRMAVAGLIKTLYEHRLNQEKTGKKMHLSDERFLKDAERLLYDEIAHVMEIEPNQVVSYIGGRLDPKN